MAIRSSYIRNRVVYQRAYRIPSGSVIFDDVDRVPELRCLYSDDDSGKRRKPALPELYPTGLKKFEWITYHGKADCVTTEQLTRYVSEGIEFTYTPFVGWGSLPGITAYGSGYGTPTCTRNVELEWECAAKLLKKVLNSSLALPVTLVESKETMNWIAKRASDIAIAMKAIKKADWRSLRRTVSNVSAEYNKLARGRTPKEARIHSNGRLGFYPKYKPTELPDTPPRGWSTKTAAARWLEVRYALAPLLADVDGIARNLAEFLYDNRMELIHRWATAIDVPPNKQDITFTCHSPRYWGGKLTMQAPWKSARMVKYSVYYVYSKWQAAFAKLQLTNAPLVAWEVVPYSFVFDWAVTLGDYLELANATVGCEFISGTISYRVAGELRSAPVVFVPKAEATTFSNVHHPWARYRAYEREVIVTFPHSLPTVRSPLSTTHVIDALALIRVLRP